MLAAEPFQVDRPAGVANHNRLRSQVAGRIQRRVADAIVVSQPSQKDANNPQALPDSRPARWA